MTAGDLAALHAVAFDGPRPWSASEFADLLAGEGVFVVSEVGGFGLGRSVAGEAELLTLAVHPDRRRQGIGRSLLKRLETGAMERGAGRMFLEVATDNPAAIGLYSAAGYAESGRRRNYYRLPDGKWTDAIVMGKRLVPA